MPRSLDPTLVEILKKYEEDPRTAAWDCHGTWVVYHKAIERIAAKAGITFDMPEVVQANADARIAVIIARGFMGDRSEWSFGEAAPSNNKNAYPFAMAEKRAKDRVVLKLVGLHGLAYSEEEADDFKADAPPPRQPDERIRINAKTGNASSASLKDSGYWAEFELELLECDTVVKLTKFALAWSGKAETDKWPGQWRDAAKEEINKRREYLLRPAPEDDTFPPDRPNAYADNFRAG